MLLPVDDDSCDLLVHEDEDGNEEGRQRTCKVYPPWVLPKGKHEPPSVHTSGLWVERSLHAAAERKSGMGRKPNPSNFRKPHFTPNSIPSEHYLIPCSSLHPINTHLDRNHPSSHVPQPPIFPRFSFGLSSSRKDSPCHDSDIPGWGRDVFSNTSRKGFIAFYLKVSRHLELWGVQSKKHIQPHKH